MQAGEFIEMPTSTFDGLSSAEVALAFLHGARHVGKCVFTNGSRMKCAADGCNPLTGSVGALGLVTTEMLAEEGARSIVLLSRSGRRADDLRGHL